MAAQPLSGIKVVDLGEGMWGAYGTKLLADFGAEVTKVERPGRGDPLRKLGPFPGDAPHVEKSGQFLYLNTSKKSITLNLESSTARKILLDLVKEADVLVESFGPGVMGKRGLDYPRLEKVNPRLVMVSISLFGESGPYRDYKATELVLAALSSWMSHIGAPDRAPLRPHGKVCEPYYPGLLAAIGVLIALSWRDVTGSGQKVEVSALEALLEADRYNPTIYAYAGEDVKRYGTSLGKTRPYDILPCQDGYICALGFTLAHWEMFCLMLGKPELLRDPRFVDNPSRAEHWEELRAIIEPWFQARTKEECFRTGQEWRLPFGSVVTIDEILDFPPHRERGFFTEVEHPVASHLKYPGRPFLMGEKAWKISPAPLLGEHNLEVYGRLGYSREDLTRLAEMGVI